MKTKLTVTFLFLVLVAPVLTTYCWLQYQKGLRKHEIKHRLMAEADPGELVLIQLTRQDAANQLEWEHAGEFEYQGEMYDVVRTQSVGDTLMYWCWWDHEETRLNRQLTTLLHRALSHDPLQKEKQLQLHVFFKSLYTHTPSNWKPLMYQPLHVPWPDLSFSFDSIALQPPSPPPLLG